MVRRQQLLSVLVSLGALTVCSGCPGDIVGEKSVIIRGIVQSSATHAPIASAWAALADSLLESRVETDSTGAFSLGSFPFLKDTLFVGAEGYLTYDTVLEDVHEDTDTLLFELMPSP